MAWIRKRKSKRGRTSYEINWRDEAGTKHSKTERDRRIALLEKERIEQEVEGRQYLRPKATHPLDALPVFLEYRIRSGRRSTTVEIDRERLAPLFKVYAAVPLARWTRSMLAAYIHGHPEWQPRTTQLTVNACKRFIRWCREDANIACPDFVGRTDGLVPPVKIKTDHDFLRVEAFAGFAAVAEGEPRGNQWIDLGVNLAFWAGLALGDIRSLEWRHVDLNEGVIRKPRQKTGEMTVAPISKPLRAALQRHPGISGFVVSQFPKSDSSSRKSLMVKCRAAGIPRPRKGQCGWHMLRHSAGTALDFAGASESTINFVLGHKPSSMTRRYIHADLKRARGAVQRLEEKYEAARALLRGPKAAEPNEHRQVV